MRGKAAVTQPGNMHILSVNELDGHDFMGWRGKVTIPPAVCGREGGENMKPSSHLQGQ